MTRQLNEIKYAKSVHANNIYHIKHGTNDSGQERRKFIMACPHDGCRGFLSSQYKCELCEQSFYEKKGLDSHMKWNHEVAKDFKCDICDYECTRKSNLNLHVKKVHQNVSV